MRKGRTTHGGPSGPSGPPGKRARHACEHCGNPDVPSDHSCAFLRGLRRVSRGGCEKPAGEGGGGGSGGLNPSPPYSVPRMYSINESRGIATETWQFLRAQPLWSPICSSIYQDGRSFLVDYASQGMPNWGSPLGNGLGYGPEIMGLDGNKQVAFDYYYPGAFQNGWNADPIHLENLQFSSSAPLLPNFAAPLQLAAIAPGTLSSLYW